MEKKYMHVMFCPPNDLLEQQGYIFNNRISEEIFQKIEDAHINVLLGWGYDNRKETILKILELCEKHHIDYYLQVHVTERYINHGDNYPEYKAFKDLTKEELEALDQEFIEEVNQYIGYKSLVGVIFEDEVGYFSYDGVAHAHDVFKKAFPNLHFYTNNLGCTVDSDWFWRSWCKEGKRPIEELDKPFELVGDLEIKYCNRFNYYPVFLEGLLDKAKFEFISFDMYPFVLDWKECPSFMHSAYLDCIAMIKKEAIKYNLKAFSYLQVGQWFNDTRVISKAEYDLMMHIQAMYQLDGFAYFPAFYPIDFILNPGYLNSDNGNAGLFDINGASTRFYDYTKENNVYFDRIADHILNAKFIGVKSYGTYYNGFSKEDVKDVKDNDVIYFGELPPLFIVEEQDVTVNKVSNNLVISQFIKDNKKSYYMTNMSTLYENDINVVLNKGKFKIYRVNGDYESSDEIKLKLNPGEGIYIIEM